MLGTINLDVAEAVGDAYFITTAGTHIIKPTACVLTRLIISCTNTCTVSVLDGDEPRCHIRMIKDTSNSFTIGIRCYDNLTIILSADSDVTVVVS